LLALEGAGVGAMPWHARDPGRSFVGRDLSEWSDQDASTTTAMGQPTAQPVDDKFKVSVVVPAEEFERFDEVRQLSAVFTVRLNGKHERKLTPWAMDAGEPSDWSPDGHWIVFLNHSWGFTPSTVWLVHPNGTALHEITSKRHGNPGDQPRGEPGAGGGLKPTKGRRTLESKINEHRMPSVPFVFRKRPALSRSDRHDT
jgi:hypothetical protein